jgi:type VI secretion system secreted protein Hcp
MPLYLKIDGIPGSSTEKSYKDQIECMSFSLGIARNFSHVAGGTAEKLGDKPQFTDLSVTKRADKASVKLFETLCTGKHITNATLYVVGTQEGDAQEFESYLIEDLLISNWSVGGAGSALPDESVTFNFAKITFKFNSRDEKGKVTPSSTGWDVKQNIKV